MRITLRRVEENNKGTIGKLLVPKDDSSNPTEFVTLEDPRQEEKIPGLTRINAGIYEIVLRQEGGFAARYDKRFEPWHDGMLHIINVPEFEYILIHCGNRPADTRGCILVGMRRGVGMTILQSAEAYSRVYKACYDAANSGDLSIEIVDPVPARPTLHLPNKT